MSKPTSPGDSHYLLNLTQTVQATVYADADLMRTGIPAELSALDEDGVLELVQERPVAVRHGVEIRLSNALQRFEKTTRGTVRDVRPLSVDRYRVQVELISRLTPYEMSMLKPARDE